MPVMTIGYPRPTDCHSKNACSIVLVLYSPVPSLDFGTSVASNDLDVPACESLGSREKRIPLMAAQCVKKDSTPPICATHGVELLKSEVPDVMKTVACFICPVSNVVVRER